MTQDRPPVDGQQQPPDTLKGADGVLVELAQVQKHMIDLLARLDRPPRNVRIQTGLVTVDIEWADTAGTPGAGRADSAGNGRAPSEKSDEELAGEFLTSPGVGVFYRAREPGADPFVSVGSVVRPGQQIGIIEVMKLMIPVEADRGGRITGVLKADREPVEYGEPLFALDVEEPEA